MMILQNHKSKAVIDVTYKGLLRELVLNGNNILSTEGCPFLFPYAGRVWENAKLSSYPIHGFASKIPWEQISDNKIRLQANDATKVIYNYDFILELEFVLTSNSLSQIVTLQTMNTELPVSLGFHPYFVTNKDTIQYSLQTDASEFITVTPEGAAGQKELRPYKYQNINLNDPKFSNLILSKIKETQCKIIDHSTNRSLKLSWDFADDYGSFIVLWSTGQNFHCVEPWMGLPDAINSSIGLRKTPKNSSKIFTFEIACDT